MRLYLSSHCFPLALVGGIWEAVLVEKYKSFVDSGAMLGNCSGASHWLLFTAPEQLPFVFNVATVPLRHKRIMNATAAGVSLFVMPHRLLMLGWVAAKPHSRITFREYRRYLIIVCCLFARLLLAIVQGARCW